MKRVHLITILLAACMTFFSGCSKNDDDGGGTGTSADLVGTWRLVEINGSSGGKTGTILTFTENGKVFSGETESSYDKDTYKFENNVIYFTYVPAYEVIWGNSWKVVSFTAKTLVADAVFNNSSSNNARLKWEKIK